MASGTLLLLLLFLGVGFASAGETEVCTWIESQTEFDSFEEFHDEAPDSCVLQTDFHNELTRDAEEQIKAGVLSPEAAYNWVEIWSSFVPTFTPTIGGLTKTYKCETQETLDLYGRMMAAVGAAAYNKDTIRRPIPDKLRGGTFIVLSADDANVDGSLYSKVVVNSKTSLSSPRTIEAPSYFGQGFGGLAVYSVFMPSSGNYSMFVRSRGFSVWATLFTVSANIFDRPTMKVNVPDYTGKFSWGYVAETYVAEPGLRRVMIASYSPRVQIDTIVLHSSGQHYSNELDFLAVSSSGVAIGAREAMLDDDSKFQLVHTKVSLSGSVLVSRESGSTLARFHTYFKRSGEYTVYMLARAKGSEDKGEVEVTDPKTFEGDYKWETHDLTWQVIGAHRTKASRTVEICIDGKDIEIAAIFFHINPNLIERDYAVLENAAAQAVAFDRVCGNSIVEYKEECDGGVGCHECHCGTGYSVLGEQCAPICGDQLRVEGEICDGGVGCSSSCVCVPGFSVTPEGFDCEPVCGDGKIVADEECDNTLGCTEECICDTGFVSTPSGECLAVCGDNIVTETEECDGGPACETNCMCEPGFIKVSGSPSAALGGCQPECGDGQVIAPEQCDSSPHCDGLCQCVAGFAPTDSHQCSPVCGDSVVVEGEECDSSNGCNNHCLCLEGFRSIGGGVCESLCGNGVIDFGEECDGGNGCLSNCVCGANFSNDPEGGCYSLCGDGIVSGSEQCDSTPHCNSDCKCDSGFESFEHTCRPICGDGVVNGNEECDGTSGCSMNCLCESGFASKSDGTCEPICGDGVLVANEVCDSVMGCGDDCHCSWKGYKRGSGNSCVSVCNDGRVVYPEECDGSPGCNNNCKCEVGFVAKDGECQAICGDNRVVGTEECDGSSGCYNCVCSSGYAASGGMCVGLTQCGNGEIEVGEECDGGAGCNAVTCQCEGEFYKSPNGAGCRSDQCDGYWGFSAWSSQRIDVMFENTRTVIIDIYALSSRGNYHYFASLSPGQRMYASSSPGKKWIVGAGNWCVDIFTTHYAQSYRL